MFAYELNWPTYGGFAKALDAAKRGRDCYAESTLHLVKRIVAAQEGLSPDFFVAIFDLDPDWFHHLNPEVFKDPAFSWIRNNAVEGVFRPKRDISIPPPLTESFERYKFIRNAHQNRSYFLTFKGNFQTYSLRSKLAALHDPEAGILILNSGSESSKSYDYNDLMSGTNFTLVVRGDALFSYRYSEAVCSGSVPVLLADSWIPPLDPVIPFASYGVQIKESEWPDMVKILRGIDEEAVVAMQRNALKLCHHSFLNVHFQWNTILEILLSDHIH